MHHIIGFVEFYLAPFLIALGLVMFFKGVVNYFLIGPSYEEGRREIGRHALAWSFILLLSGLLVFSLFKWLGDFTGRFTDEVDIERRDGVDVLPVPNAPQRN